MLKRKNKDANQISAKPTVIRNYFTAISGAKKSRSVVGLLENNRGGSLENNGCFKEVPHVPFINNRGRPLENNRERPLENNRGGPLDKKREKLEADDTAMSVL